MKERWRDEHKQTNKISPYNYKILYLLHNVNYVYLFNLLFLISLSYFLPITPITITNIIKLDR